LAAASFSSFIVNAMVGGGMMADGLGLDSRVNSTSTKVLAAVALVVGCLVSLATIFLGKGMATTTSLLVAQASTLLAVPLCAILLLLLTSSRRVMGDLKNSIPTIVAGSAGLLVLLWLAWDRLTHLIAPLLAPHS
jgi:Mn2+/Fe2+ NRAMP family transporter